MVSMINELSIKSRYRVVVQVYLLIHCRRTLQETLDMLASDDNDYFPEVWSQFTDSDVHSDIVNMFFGDFNKNEAELSKYVKRLKKFMKTLPKHIKKDISSVLKAYQNEEVDVWAPLQILLLGFGSRVVAKIYNRMKENSEKLEYVRLEAMIYLAVAFNEMGIYEMDYAGETMLEEMVEVQGNQDVGKLQNLIARLCNILEF